MVLVLLGLWLALAPGGARADRKPDPPSPAAVFAALEAAIKANDEVGFKIHWHPEGYEHNLVGGSGIPGKAVFRQGARKKWFPKPDLAGATVLRKGDAVIVTCDIWRWTDDRVVDRVDALLVKVNGKYLVLGGGEKRAQVEALAARWLNKQPLAPRAEPKD